MVLPFSSPSLNLLVVIAGPEETKNQRGKSPPTDSDLFSDAEFEKSCRLVKQKSQQSPADAD
jgi:hypothetical protein